MRETRASIHRAHSQRGFAMAFVFVLIALLLIIAILVVTGAFNAQSSAQAVSQKYAVLNAAEGAANIALNNVAAHPVATPGCTSGNLNQAAYRSCVGYNNLGSAKYTQTFDYATNNLIYVPAHSAYIYGDATYQGNRKVYVEAIAQPAPPLQMPAGAINAAQNVNDLRPQTINNDPLHPNDADVHANNNINVSGFPSNVYGATFAVGTDQLPGQAGQTSNAPSVTFPNPVQVIQTTRHAMQLAQSGASYTGMQIAGTGSHTYLGNLYVSGDLVLSSGTVTLSAGSDVFIDGNLCISGTGTLLNQDGSQGIMVVNGVVSSSGSGGYQVPVGQNTLLLVLGNDVTSNNPCNNGATDAVYLAPNGLEGVGTIFAANGSLSTGGPGNVTGALDARLNVDIGGSDGSAITYDAAQANTTMTTGTLTYTTYAQY